MQTKGQKITGWAIIVVLSLAIACNMGLILYSDIKKAVRRIKFWCIRRQKLKQRAKVANLTERGQRIAKHRQKAKEEYAKENASNSC